MCINSVILLCIYVKTGHVLEYSKVWSHVWILSSHVRILWLSVWTLWLYYVYEHCGLCVDVVAPKKKGMVIDSDEEEEEEDDMDDFIDDEGEEDMDVVSGAIKDLFGYDKRK